MKHRDIQPGLPGTRAAALVCAAFVLLATRDAGSTTLLKLSVEQMSEEAALIVHGHVAWNYTTRNEAEGPIYTYTGFEVETCVAGECPDAVTLKHRGGTVGDLTLYIPGMPRFADGQEALLFLRPDPEGEEGRWAVFGMVQGFFHVVTEPASGEKLAFQDLSGIALAEKDPADVISIAPKSPAVIEELDDLVARIRIARDAAGEGGGK